MNFPKRIRTSSSLPSMEVAVVLKRCSLNAGRVSNFTLL